MTKNADAYAFIECEDINTVKDFFDEWSLYKKVMDSNYLHHFEVYEILHSFLLSHFQSAFSLLDLGCGDAHFMANALQRTRIREYIGVDISKNAISMAYVNMASLDCRKFFSIHDFRSFMEDGCNKADIVWMGLSFHHLSLPEKDKFIAICHQALSDGGYLMIFDPVKRNDEDRLDFIKRWWALIQKNWQSLSIQEKDSLFQHVFSSDYPEDMHTFIELGRDRGYKKVFSLYCDWDDVYRLICFMK